MHHELAELYAKRPGVIKPGLARMQAAIAALDGRLDLGLATPTVIVGGTNGKGSTSGMLYQLLAASGLRVGVFSSPHLLHFCERIQVSAVAGAPPRPGPAATSPLLIDDARLVTTLTHLKRELPPELYAELSFFELNTLLAWLVFRQCGTEVNVLEVGMGGRWDSTNACDPELAVITSIGLDHQEYLGSTVAAIAREKAGIMRRGRPVIWAGEPGGEADAVIRAEARHRGATLITCGGDAIAATIPLPELAALPPRAGGWPPFLAKNLRTAATAFAVLACGDRARAFAALQAGALPPAPSLAARFQRVDAAPTGEMPRPLLLDVCHNPDGARALVQGLRAVYGDVRLPGLISVLGDKDVNAVLDELRGALEPLVLYPQSNERAWRREQLATRHGDLAWQPDLAAAWRATHHLDGILVCCGSVYGLGELLAFLGEPTQAKIGL